MRFFQKILLISIIALLTSCTHPTMKFALSESSNNAGIVVSVQDRLSSIKGYGSLTVSENGNRQTGSFDVHWIAGNIFNAHFYSPFGTILGSVVAHGDSGYIRFNNQEHHLRLDDPVDLFFSWSPGVSLRDIIILLTGRIVSDAVKKNLPDTSYAVENREVKQWESEKTLLSYFFSKDFRHLKRIVYNYSTDVNENYSMVFQSFYEGFSRYITFKADDRNYFSLKFERFRYKK